MKRGGNRFTNSGLTASIVALVSAVDPSSIEVVDDVLVGRWAMPRVLEEAALRNGLESLMNSRLGPQEIKLFVEKYGPLFSDWRSGGTGFREPLESWRTLQNRLREQWDTRTMSHFHRLHAQALTHAKIEISPEIRPYFASGLRLAFGWLGEALELILNAIPKNQLGVCKNPSCSAPWFLRQRPREAYCGRRGCADYGRRLAKRTWWGKNRAKGKEVEAPAPRRRTKRPTAGKRKK